MGTRRNFRNRSWIVVLITSLILSGCLKNVDPGNHYVFLIPANKHYSTRLIKKFNRTTLYFAFKFDESAQYKLDTTTIDQLDTNKLFGFMYGLNPHKNSARFGWRWSIDNQYIEIRAYVYVDGIKYHKPLGICFINEIVSGKIENTDGTFIFTYQGNTLTFPKTINDGNTNYSYPYFGGNQVAPHDITIEIWH